MSNYTDEQLLVINHRAGHARVIACPGSGKSHSLAGRVKSLVEEGTPSDKVVSMMFNAEARDSFKAKLQGILKNRAPKTFTFHGQGTELIKYLEAKGLITKKQLVTSEKPKLDLMRKVLAPYVKESDDLNPYRTALEFSTFVDNYKSQLESPQIAFNEFGFSPKYRFFVEALKRFEKVRTSENKRFFSDLIWEPVKFFLGKENSGHLEEFQNLRQLDHILVDEYQDINPIQQSLVKIIAGKTAAIMAVGDDDQTIYQFAGARPEFLIDKFLEDYPDAKTYHLTRTFRYGPQVSMLASHIISSNNNRIEKMCVSATSTPQTEVIFDEEKAEQATLIGYLDEWTTLGKSLKDVAVLVRSFHQSVPVQLSLLNKGIPFRLEGGKSVFSYPLIQSLIAALHIANGSFTRLSTYDQRDLAYSVLTWPTTYMSYETITPLREQVTNSPEKFSSVVNNFVNEHSAMQGVSRSRLLTKAQAWNDFQILEGSPKEIIEQAFKQLDINRMLSSGDVEEDELDEHMSIYEKFLGFVEQQTENLGELLTHIDHMRSIELPKNSNFNGITITSLHRSKGLEWPMVIIPGLSQGRIPLIPRVKSQVCDIEEERRLFFVGITRAINALVLIGPADQDLMHWLEAGRKGAPNLEASGTPSASTFLYESNIFVSQQAAAIIEGNPKYLRSGIENTAVVNAYLEHIGAAHRMS